ncbi:tetratricopeptide repeat protein [Herbaspirillum sp. HC18]|nr:tetratricopeptide repeat protein [Herbaspirillum sp. HC18]
MEKREITDWINKRYLLIDDFPNICLMLSDMLRSIGAHYIDQANNGAVAVALLRKNKYDVVLCDYHLGGEKNGQQVLEEAKLRDLMGPAGIWLMVSGVKNVESVMGAAEYQPDGYLLKPLTEAFLLKRLNRAWAKKQVFKEIDHAYYDKEYLKAVDLCDEALLTDRLHALDLMRMKANLLMKSGELERARAVFEQVMVEREFVWAKTGIAKIHLQNGEYDSARQLLQEVIEENVYYLDAYDQLAAAELQMGNFAEAEKVLESAAKISPNSVLRQKNLGAIALKLGNIDVAAKAFRKSVEIGQHSILKTPDAYFGLARAYGEKGYPDEALQLLASVQKEFNTGETRLRAKVTEGLVHHESGEWIKARKSGDELAELLSETSERPGPDTCLDMARLLFAVGVKEVPVELLREVVKNNHDNVPLALEVQHIFDKARMSEQGAEVVAAARKEASEMMDRGVILWKAGKLGEAVEWMRNARIALPSNVRVLFNCAHLLIAYMEQNGPEEGMLAEAKKILLHADKLNPNQRRFSQLFKQLAALSPEGEG